MQKTICLNGNLIDCTTPKVMGILNVTTDSFYDGGKYTHEKEIKTRAIQIIEQGGDIIDVGAYSSRPGADDVSSADEYDRLRKALLYINQVAPDFPWSIDTFRAEIVEKLFDEFGGFIVNDITGGNADNDMFQTIAKLHLPYIMMHMRGTPQTMQSMTEYDNMQEEILKYFAGKVNRLYQIGVADIIIDLGFGFSKTLDQNYELLSNLENYKIMDLPILVGISRKSMIYKYLESTPDESLTGTIVLNTIALQKGASFIRVHDVKEAVDTVRLVNKLGNSVIRNK